MSGMFARPREVALGGKAASLYDTPATVAPRGDPIRRHHAFSRRQGRRFDPVEAPRRILSETTPSIGSLLYLGFVGLVAAGIVAVFFGAGFLLLVPHAGGEISGNVARAASAVIVLPSRRGADDQTLYRESTNTAYSSAILPPSRVERPPADNNPPPHPVQAGTPTPPVAQETPSASTEVISRPSDATEARAPAATTLRLSAAELGDLVEHGDSLLRTGDVASARLFYERAADAGDGRAALRLGATFDPSFLVRFGGSVQADAASARSWYSRAFDLGTIEARGQLSRLETRQGK